jgi:hypothetical protein
MIIIQIKASIEFPKFEQVRKPYEFVYQKPQVESKSIWQKLKIKLEILQQSN